MYKRIIPELQNMILYKYDNYIKCKYENSIICDYGKINSSVNLILKY